ncbi:CapA family protein [Robertkochia flava]|uniref:CapA family protein n=1 Tax=Robertkochia flava TaxID=3447986 RepID=UPI001CCFDEAD|nr:CapA family protein [Robertkochia marina]
MKCEIVICGDICPTKDTLRYFEAGRPEPLFNDLLSVFENADLVLGNLEFVLTDNPKPIVKAGPILHGSTKCIDVLKSSGFNLLSLANNHIKDCGEEGVKSTLEACREVNIDTLGAGANLEEAKKPYLKEINGFKIGILSFAEQEFNCASENEYGANFFDPYEDLDLIEDVKREVDYLVILYHGGVEYYEYPSPQLQKKCRRFVDKGADFVTCQHSHCIGTIENYQDKSILYGQGNTVFGFREGDDSWNQGLVVKLNLVRDEIGITNNINLIPIQAANKGIRLIDKDNSKKLLKALFLRSSTLSDKEFIQTSWEHFCGKKKHLYIPWLFGFNRYLIHLNRISQNSIVNLLFGKKQKAVSHNIIRCEAHNEVIQELLKD